MVTDAGADGAFKLGSFLRWYWLWKRWRSPVPWH